MRRTLIIGGGAAGFFAAAQLAKYDPDRDVTILEASDKILQKVKVSGGGRCNVTNAVFELEDFAKIYPRGWKLMRKLFAQFSNRDTIQWFESRGVPLYAQSDNRMFPESNDSQTIVDCLRDSALHNGVELIRSAKVNSIVNDSNSWIVKTLRGQSFSADQILIATGSNKSMHGILSNLGVKMVTSVPSLFTFNIDDPIIAGLPGVAIERSMVRIAGTKFQSDGPLLITHWGLSAPAVLKLSAWAARDLNDKNYKFTALVNWSGYPVEEAKAHLDVFRESFGRKKLFNAIPFSLPKRLWSRLLSTADIDDDKRWSELGKKQWNVLIERLTNTTFQVDGKSTFKEEFVTSGGVALKEVQPKTMEHRKFPGLYFAGEVLDIDAVTGGYNFQAAWTTAFVAAQSIVSK